MSTKSNVNQEIDRLAKILADLVEIFRKGKAASDFQWWQNMSNLFRPYFGYQDGQPLFEAVVQGILKLNPEMLSEYEIKHKLVYDFLQNQAIDYKQAEHLYNESLKKEAKKHLNKLVEFEAWQDVDIAIVNLLHEGEPVQLGEVIFMGITKEELEQWKKRGPVSERISDVRVVARVKAPGDRQKALFYTITCVNQALDVIRAFCFPFGRQSDTWLVGLLGDIIDSKHTPTRIDGREFVTLIGSGIAQIELQKHILSKLEQAQWELINKLILKEEHSRSDMESKLLDGIHWLAESTKPDTNNSRFAKISFALETLIGGEPKDEDLKVRGITAMLAERAAFIIGEEFDDRWAIDKEIRKYYGLRSNIVHGGEGDVSLDDIDNFGQLVRRLALALLEKLDELGDEIRDIEELEKWVKVQRYTAPENDG